VDHAVLWAMSRLLAWYGWRGQDQSEPGVEWVKVVRDPAALAQASG